MNTVATLHACSQIKGHKLLFETASPVFKVMLSGNWAEKNQVKIEDVNPSTFKALMKYIYTDEISFDSVATAISIYEACEKYDLVHLKKVSAVFISSKLVPANVCSILDFALFYKDETVTSKCFNIIKTKTDAVLETSDFLSCSLKILNNIVTQSEFNVSELHLFKAIEKWARSFSEKLGCSLGNVVKDLTFATSNVRYLSMTVREFSKGPGVSELLTIEERFSLLMNIINRNSIPLPERFNLPNSNCLRYKQPVQSNIQIGFNQPGYYTQPEYYNQPEYFCATDEEYN
ncbi:BTB/POZ domain-containing protein 6-like isoform X2 [Lycorma delicatula]|uniref:BTB/POZ domain-containing protein 6-like isoform X2 n=1 Tax=Lycorma delicatula TaxID=130591 RepID=UPI003F515203